jgi:hypothetical protein
MAVKIINKQFKKSIILLIFLIFFTILLSGCEQIFSVKNYVKSFFHEEVVFFYASSDYPNEGYDSRMSWIEDVAKQFHKLMPKQQKAAISSVIPR